jgi:hypothetical protein
VRKRDVAHNDDEDMTREPEMVQAYRDTWELGLHSYLTYLRDRLLLARDLLAPSGSIFVQISDENLHHVREVMDEVLGAENFCALVSFHGRKFFPPGGKSWSTNRDGIEKLKATSRLFILGKDPYFKSYHTDFPLSQYENCWTDKPAARAKVYVVQTAEKFHAAGSRLSLSVAGWRFPRVDSLSAALTPPSQAGATSINRPWRRSPSPPSPT